MQRTVGVIFGGALTVGSGGVFLALLVIVGVVFATVMFVLKVLVLLWRSSCRSASSRTCAARSRR
ncbi:MAG: hypothetical protein ACYCUM_09585 [Solirubrobacteraceae bacterium]